ncbi:MAG: hypothetical protein U0T72_09045 [Chitinophagales bacterium]
MVQLRRYQTGLEGRDSVKQLLEDNPGMIDEIENKMKIFSRN